MNRAPDFVHQHRERTYARAKRSERKSLPDSAVNVGCSGRLVSRHGGGNGARHFGLGAAT
jgi:hypothetical protein